MMKLAVLVVTVMLMVAAAPGAVAEQAATSSECDKTCTREYIPVCGSNGKRYPNQCLLQVAQCEDPTITQAGDDEC